MAINPSAWSIQKIVTYITAAGDWLRSAKLDHHKWADRYYRTAEMIAMAEKNGANVFKFLDELWPAGLRGNQVHYNGRPFDAVMLVPAEELADCVIAPPLKNFRFKPQEAWPEESAEVHEERFESPVRKPAKRMKAEVIDLGEDDEDDESDEDNIPKPFASQFKPTKKRKFQ